MDLARLSRTRRSLDAVGFGLIASAAFGADGLAQGHRLSPPLAEQSSGEVQQFALGAGGHVVYILAPYPGGRTELRGVPLDGSSASILLGPPALSAGPANLLLSANRTRVVFRMTGLRNKLYAAPVDGSQSAVELTPVPYPGISIAQYDASPVSACVVYIAHEFATGKDEIFSVPDDASSAPIALNAPLPVNGMARAFALAHHSDRVVFTADASAAGVVELWSAPISGGVSPVKISPALPVGGGVTSILALTPDDQTVVFVADASTDEVYELYAAPSDGHAPALKLSGTLVSGGDLLTYQRIAISPDGTRVVYRADGTADGVTELYSVRSTRARRRAG